ncbi:MAG: hypothetical protein Fur0021_21370 [Candidatus Promineifilaceae bacterium]
MVREVVTRLLGQPGLSGQSQPTAAAGPRRLIVDAADVEQMPANSQQTLPAQTILTPLARQTALERRITFVDEGALPAAITTVSAGQQVVALGADHGGYGLKEQLKKTVAAAGYAVADCGTHSTEAVDYPDFAYVVARMVANGQAWRGIIVDGAGIGSCMAANKVPGVRAAMCYDQATAINSREHNNANVLTLGAGLIGPNLAQQIALVWLQTEFGGGRHARRVEKIEAIEKRFAKG